MSTPEGKKTRTVKEVVGQNQSLGGRLRHAREFRGVTQVDMAAYLGISKRHLIRFEKDDVVPNLAVVEKIAHMTRSNVEWLLHERGNMAVLKFEDDAPAHTTSTEIVWNQDGNKIRIVPKDDGIYIISQRPVNIKHTPQAIIVGFS